MTKPPHWTQTPEGKIKMADAQRKAWATKRAKMKAMARTIVTRAKRGPYKKKKAQRTTNGTSAPFVVRVHGYRIFLSRDEIRIEPE